MALGFRLGGCHVPFGLWAVCSRPNADINELATVTPLTAPAHPGESLDVEFSQQAVFPIRSFSRASSEVPRSRASTRQPYILSGFSDLGFLDLRIGALGPEEGHRPGRVEKLQLLAPLVELPPGDDLPPPNVSMLSTAGDILTSTGVTRGAQHQLVHAATSSPWEYSGADRHIWTDSPRFFRDEDGFPYLTAQDRGHTINWPILGLLHPGYYVWQSIATRQSWSVRPEYAALWDRYAADCDPPKPGEFWLSKDGNYIIEINETALLVRDMTGALVDRLLRPPRMHGIFAGFQVPDVDPELYLSHRITPTI